ncbi:hypothetical protein OF83DRAFT_415525 [Amylostereum chailletii]|nr:hypothetical protein OF83DRAFT_415525 [Amylostereum chailletii]
MFRVLGYTPHEGDEGVPITVETRFQNHYPDRRVFLRMVIGTRAVGTDIHRIGDGDAEVWRLEGTIPPFHAQRSESPIVAISIQAVDGQNNILDSVTFGEFTYWSSGGSPEIRVVHSNRPRASSVTIPVASQHVSNRRASCSTGPTSSTAGSPSSRTLSHTPRQQLLRRREIGDNSDVTGERAILEFLTPLEDAGQNLTEEEKHAGRRLVRFSRTLEGNRLRISCQVIHQEDYDDRCIAISCIYRESTGLTYFTSVDIIFLLQYFVQDSFGVEEKNRIRRNLEGFRPTTISKSRSGSEGFFQQIMEFPVPKPRNIEKDVKVFSWDTLGPALDKIIAKYSLVPGAVEIHSNSPPMLHTPSQPDPTLTHLELSYPSPSPQPVMYQSALLDSYERDQKPSITPPGSYGAGMSTTMLQGPLTTAVSFDDMSSRGSGSDRGGDFSGYHGGSYPHHGEPSQQQPQAPPGFGYPPPQHSGFFDGSMGGGGHDGFGGMHFQGMREHKTNAIGGATPYM